MRKVLNGDIPGKRSQRLLNMERRQWGKCWMVIYQAKDHRDYWTWSARNEESVEWWYTRQKITETNEHGAQAMRKVLNGDIPGKRSQRLLNMEHRQWGKCWMVIYQAKDHRDYWTWNGAHAMRKVLNGDIPGKRSHTIEHRAHAMRKVLNGDIPGKDHRDYWTWSARNEESAEWWYTRQEITETIEHGAHAMRKVLNGDIPGKRSQRLLNVERTQWGKCWMVIYQAKITETIEHRAHAMRKVLNGDIPGKDHRDYWTSSARNEESVEWWYTRQR